MTKSCAAFKAAVITFAICTAVGVIAGWSLWKWNLYSDGAEGELLLTSRALGGTIAQIAVTLAGFILTSTAIFTAFSDKPLVQNMYRSGHASNLITHMYVAIFFTVVASSAGIWALVSPAASPLTISSLVGSAAACLAALAGVMRKLWYVLQFVNGGAHNEPEYETVDHTAKEVRSHSG